MFLQNLKKYNVVLGSKSPRRAFLLKETGITFTQRSIDLDESFPADLINGDVVEFLAQKKADAFKSELKDNDLLITADTIVVYENEVLGKPADKKDAIRLLSKLSSRTHKVFTGVCLLSDRKNIVFHTMTEVTFKDLSEEEIEYYISKYNPYDKAGAYGIQEWFGYVCVEKINGSYTNVMGLPIKEICDHLKTF
ncbi:MAG: septum formation protein Maf [Bacteroidia bacterium]|nr:septum formation protein Maf [Bacteroidia bacterium]